MSAETSVYPSVALIEILPEYAEFLTQQEAQVSPWPWTACKLEHSVASGHQCLRLGSADQSIGYCVLLNIGEVVEILNFVVFLDHQKRGFARMMLEQIKPLALRQGATKLWLEVRADNRRAIKVYRAAGFNQTGRRKHYYPAHDERDGSGVVDALLMESVLSSPVGTNL